MTQRVQLERVLPARPGRAFALHTDPDELARWWGPRGFTTPSVELDVRVGGRYRIEMQPPEGASFFLTGEFREIVPPSRLVYTFWYEEPDPSDVETVVTFSLSDLGDTTRCTVDQGVFATDTCRVLHQQGWTETLDRLYELISAEGDQRR